ncbi:hypothetical protein SMC26_40355 [Actinomadura fulvescens]|uniref:Capsid maturation protease n=1 Tax=Actinomadura fulvescens TaxID=46160 RepID=A0ABN3Q7H4_9ACTN
MATAEALAEQQRQDQAQLRAQVARDVLAVWNGMLDPAEVDASWPGLRDILARLVGDRRAESANMAAEYYLAARNAAQVGGAVAPVVADVVDGGLLRTVLDVTGPAAFKRAVAAGMTPQQARQHTGVQLAGAASRLVLDGGRATVHRTVHADDAALGYARVTDANPCPFCAMLAGRGAVYKNEGTAGRTTNQRFKGDGEFKFHDHCACIAAPVFSRDEAWLGHSKDLGDEWDRVTKGLSGANARREWRRQWNAKQRDQRADAERRRVEAEQEAAQREAERQQAERQEAERRAQDEAATRAADPLADVDVRALSDDEIAELFAQYGDELPHVADRLMAELERRDQADQAGDSFGTLDDEPTDDERRVAELVDQGWEWRDAYAEVHNLDPNELDRQERAAAVDAQRGEGETRDQAVRRLYDEWLHAQYLAAEDATRGYLLNKQGEAAGIDPISLFSGPASRARKYASEELKRWWAEDGNQRMTFAEFKADTLGRESDRRAAQRTREGGTGREYGL